MEDRELLELAAKAAGYAVDCAFRDAPLIFGEDAGPDGPREWNPLTEDGDALRLSVDLNLHVKCWVTGVDICDGNGVEIWCEYKEPNQCRYEMIRRAITSAAAEIGRAMP